MNFAAFGISDLVEMHSGAWWEPWWLATWKGACVVVMVLQLWQYARHKRRMAAQGSPQVASPLPRR